MPTYDFTCPQEHDYEVRCSIASKEADIHPCPECGGAGHAIILRAPHLCTVIVPMYPGSKAVSAGTVHSHGPKSATKVMSGPGGCTKPADSKISSLIQPEAKREFRNNGT